MPAAYLIVEMHITDMEQYKQYMAAAPAAMKALRRRVPGARRPA